MRDDPAAALAGSPRPDVSPRRVMERRASQEDPMFGDSMFDEEDRLRRAEEGREEELETRHEEHDDFTPAGGLDDRLRRRQAIAELLREVGGC